MNQESVNDLTRLYNHAKTVFKIEKSYEEIIKTPEDRIFFLRSIIKSIKDVKEGKEKDKLIKWLDKNIENINKDKKNGIDIPNKYIEYYDYIEKAPSIEEIEMYFKILKINIESFQKKSNYNFEIPLSELYTKVTEKLSIEPHNIVHMLGLTKTKKDSIQESILEEIKKEYNIDKTLTPEEGIKLISENFEEYKNKYINFAEKIKRWEETYKKQKGVKIDENGYIKRDNKYKKAYEKEFGKKYIYFNQNLAKLISYYNFLNFYNLNEIVVDYEDKETHKKRNNSRETKKIKPDVFLASYNIEKYDETYMESLAGKEDTPIVSLVGFKTNGYEIAQTNPNIDKKIELSGNACTQMQTSVMTLNDEYYRYSHYFFIDLITEGGKPIYISDPKQKIIYDISHGREKEAENLKESLINLNTEWKECLKDIIKKEPNYKIAVVLKLREDGSQVSVPAPMTNDKLDILRKYLEKLKGYEIKLNHKRFKYIRINEKLKDYKKEKKHKHR